MKKIKQQKIQNPRVQENPKTKQTGNSLFGFPGNPGREAWAVTIRSLNTGR